MRTRGVGGSKEAKILRTYYIHSPFMSVANLGTHTLQYFYSRHIHLENPLQAEVPGSPVPEPKLRDSRFKSRLGIGLGIDIRAM